jgi:hypothetical protein
VQQARISRKQQKVIKKIKANTKYESQKQQNQLLSSKE